MNKILKTLALPLSVVIGIILFILWMNMVGNPHVVETVIGLIIGLVAAVVAWRSLTWALNSYRRS